jgi:hypothetical protein
MEGIPQALKREVVWVLNAKAEALAYLEARTKAKTEADPLRG